MNILHLVFIFTVLSSLSTSFAIIDQTLKEKFNFKGENHTENVLVSFTKSVRNIIDQINQFKFDNISEKRSALTKAQIKFSNKAQWPLHFFLDKIGIHHKTCWISNKMVISEADFGLVQAISHISGILKIEEEPVITIPFKKELHFGEFDLPEGPGYLWNQPKGFIEWGVRKIRANQVWNMYTGKVVVVAGIDTGVRHTHRALKNNWRQEYGWFDAYLETTTPRDDHGHGTHTMGTIVGTDGIGVAPEATWIACKGCDGQTGICGYTQLCECAQWVQCPTEPNGTSRNCDMAPNIVSNSWGAQYGGNNWFDEVIRSWQAAGIVSVFAAGDNGPDCGTAGSPGDRPDAISVGAIDSKDMIYLNSSMGPSGDGRIKPDIVAPGVQILSAWGKSDWSYKYVSGTSMACPHVSGVVALMLEKNPKLALEPSKIHDVITKTAERELMETGLNETCGLRDSLVFPNNVYGYGRIDAINALEAA